MSERRICKYCGMELSEDVPHGLRQCHLHAVARIAELKGFIGQLIEAGDAMSNAHSMWVAEEDKWDALVKDWEER